ncbi:MAG: transposase [Gloeocapsa sp. UFS-A4-WI-NPMV-4B04]|nr:transposase [Gloeocapsa sp. UFS-A4-WI-NPMV-4B04]
MKNRLMPMSDRLLLPKRTIIETIPKKPSIDLEHNLLTAT